MQKMDTLSKEDCSKLTEYKFSEYSTGTKHDDDWICAICCFDSLQ